MAKIRTPDEMQPTPRSEQMAGPVRDASRMLSLALEPESFDPAESGRGFTLAVSNYAARALGTAGRVAGALSPLRPPLQRRRCVLEGGNKLCKGKPIANLIVWKWPGTRPIHALCPHSPAENQCWLIR